jgi:hypothetical protein
MTLQIVLLYCKVTHNGTDLRRVDNRYSSAQTVAKFIIKSSLLLQLLNKDSSAWNPC